MSECSHDCSSCGESCGERTAPMDLRAPLNELSSVGKVIAVVSGKGGVGTSTVTCSLAAAMAQLGKKVAVLDADITGPSVPTAFGIHEHAVGSELGIYPAVSQGGVELMSLNLLTEHETDPVIWRGPVIAGTVKQFWTDVIWGDVDYMFVDMPPGTGDVPLTVFQSLPVIWRGPVIAGTVKQFWTDVIWGDVDYMFVDMPPGTGDVPLTVFQSLPVDGVIVVTSPQDLVSMIVTKAVKMAEMMNIPILGIVENYSYFQCPDCGKHHAIFGESRVQEVADGLGLKVLAQLPIDPALAAACDNGGVDAFQPNPLEPLARELAAGKV